MKKSIAILSAFALTFSVNALSAKALVKSGEKPRDLSFQKDIVNDGYFASGDCDKYLDGLTLPEQYTLRQASSVLEINEMLFYVTGGRSDVKDFQDLFKGTRYTINPELEKTKGYLAEKPNRMRSYSDEIFSLQKGYDAKSALNTIYKSNLKTDHKIADNAVSFAYCRIAAAATGVGVYANRFLGYVSYVNSMVSKSKIGFFEVSADSSEYGASVNTGNQYAEPKKWEGSRFFEIRASFKNLDTESRLPVEGSLFINYNGKDYEFDSVEPIMLEGYNIWFKKINPLITMKTKIVYRIPDEIHGEVFWRPGRNPSDTKLWLGFISAAKSN